MDLTEPVLLTPEGLEKLKRDLEVALTRRAEAGERLKEAFQPGDIEDNPEYEQAKEEVGLLDSRIYELQEMIGRAEIIKESHSSVAGPGSTIDVAHPSSEIDTSYARGSGTSFSAAIASEKPEGALSLADTLLHTPAVQFLTTGQAIQHNPKEPITIGYMRFDNGTMPTLMSDEPRLWHDLERAQLARESAPKFLFAQLFNAFFVGALFWLLARARLLPKYAPAIAAAVWVASAARFL